jgi:uncharacterized protein YjbI with pentapeptide repeats
MPGTFAGKLAFRSTNQSGPTFYLTSLVGQGTVLPSVSAPALTDSEKVILYAQPDGGYVVVLAVPTRFTGAISLAYLKGQPDLGFVTTDPSAANAQELRISPFGAVEGGWSIYDTNKDVWTTLAYVVGSQMASLVYSDMSDGTPSQPSLLGVAVTPGYAELASSKHGVQADLRYTDLSGLDLRGVDFTGADFTGAILTDTKLGGGAVLASAIFTGATMTGTDLTGAKLDGAVMSGLDLSSVVWGTGISAAGAHFRGSLLVGCTIGSTNATANLSKADFTGADLSGANLTGANLNSAQLCGANLTGATLDSADLTLASLGGSANDPPAILAYALMGNGILTNANLFGVNFTAATIYGGETKLNSAATLEQADFSNAYLEAISFNGSNLKGARFDGACLIGTDFTGAVLTASGGSAMPVSFAGACLPGAVFTNAQIAGANFANAAISFAQGSFPVSYCTAMGLIGPVPINCGPTTGLDLTTLQPATICPNGSTRAANDALGFGLTAMLTAKGAPTGWTAAACLVPPTGADSGEPPARVPARPASRSVRASVHAEPDGVR